MLLIIKERSYVGRTLIIELFNISFRHKSVAADNKCIMFASSPLVVTALEGGKLFKYLSYKRRCTKCDNGNTRYRQTTDIC